MNYDDMWERLPKEFKDSIRVLAVIAHQAALLRKTGGSSDFVRLPTPGGPNRVAWIDMTVSFDEVKQP